MIEPAPVEPAAAAALPDHTRAVVVPLYLLRLPCCLIDGNFFATARSTSARTDGEAFAEARESAALAWLGSSTGYDRDGPANDLAGSLFRSFVVSFAMVQPPE